MTAIDVCAAVIRKGGKILLATRPPGAHLAGTWEFPGGKVSGDETLSQCICREIREELGLRVVSARHVDTVEHEYPEKRIVLHFLECVVAGSPVPVCHDGQAADWFTLAEIAALDLAPADRVFAQRLGVACPSPQASRR